MARIVIRPVLVGLPASPLRLLDRCRLEQQCGAMLGALGCNDWDVAVVIAPDDELRELNRTYRSKDAPTDVLSFAFHDQLPSPGALPQGLHEEEKNLGDLFLGWPYISRQAERRGTRLDLELVRLTAHGLCHLAGYVHHSDRSHREMAAMETKLLEGAGLSSESIITLMQVHETDP